MKKGEKIKFCISSRGKRKRFRTYNCFEEELIGKYLSEDLKGADNSTILKSGFNINKEILDKIVSAKINKLKLANVDAILKGPYIFETIKVDKNNDKQSALADIYKVLRPGEPPTPEVAEEVFKNLYFSNERYDLSDVGRVKLNTKLDLKQDDNLRVLTKKDMVSIIQFMLDLRDGKGDVDDIDHLGNRRVRSVLS